MKIMPIALHRPTGTSSRRLGLTSKTGRVISGLFLLQMAACADPAPMVVRSTFTDTSTPSTGINPAAGSCRLAITDLRDSRRSPDILGIVGGMAIKAPDDRATWLRSKITALGQRGFEVEFNANPQAGDTVTAQVSLTSIWVTEIATSKSASVLLHMIAQGPKGLRLERNYRTSVARINWSSTKSELNGLVDSLFTKVLDSMALDLHRICGGANP